MTSVLKLDARRGIRDPALDTLRENARSLRQAISSRQFSDARRIILLEADRSKSELNLNSLVRYVESELKKHSKSETLLQKQIEFLDTLKLDALIHVKAVISANEDRAHRRALLQADCQNYLNARKQIRLDYEKMLTNVCVAAILYHCILLQIRMSLHESIRLLPETPPGSVEALDKKLTSEECALDHELIRKWPKDTPIRQRIFARAAERLTLSWLKIRYPVSAVFDLSACQHLGDHALPPNVRFRLQKIDKQRRTTLHSADCAVVHNQSNIIFYDAKSTSKSRLNLDFLFRGTKLVTRSEVLFVAVWTDIDRFAPTNTPTGNRYVLGEASSDTLSKFMDFCKKSARNVAIPCPGMGFRHVIGREFPGIFFPFPEDALKRNGEYRSATLSDLGAAAEFAHTFPELIICNLASGRKPGFRQRNFNTIIAHWFLKRLRKRHVSRANLLPSLGELYILTLQLFVIFCRRSRLIKQIDQLILLLESLILQLNDSDLKFPLAAWDPSGSYSALLLGMRTMAELPDSFAQLSRIIRLELTSAGTLLATMVDGEDKEIVTLTAHCECGYKPLVRGVPLAANTVLPNGCPACGNLICPKCSSGCYKKKAGSPDCLSKKLSSTATM